MHDDIKKPGECCGHCRHEVESAFAELEQQAAQTPAPAFAGTAEDALALLLHEAFKNPSPEIQAIIAKHRQPLRPRIQQQRLEVVLEVKVDGKKGERRTVELEDERKIAFKLLKKVATDTRDGEGVRVRDFGGDGFDKPWRLSDWGFYRERLPVLTKNFTDSPLGCGVSFPVSRKLILDRLCP